MILLLLIPAFLLFIFILYSFLSSFTLGRIDMVTYSIASKLKNPWFGKPYVEYHLVKHWSEFVMDWPDNWGDDRNFQEIILKSKDRNSIENFKNQLEK